MVQYKLHFLVFTEAVQGAGREVLEGVIGGCEKGHALVGVVELVRELGEDLGLVEEAEEGGVLASLDENCREVNWSGGAWSRSRWCLRKSCREEEQEVGK